jgi:hypothetical protein
VSVSEANYPCTTFYVRRLFNTNDWLERYEEFVLRDLASVLLGAQVPFILRSDTMAKHIGQGLSTQIQQGTVGITGLSWWSCGGLWNQLR